MQTNLVWASIFATSSSPLPLPKNPCHLPFVPPSFRGMNNLPARQIYLYFFPLQIRPIPEEVGFREEPACPAYPEGFFQGALNGAPARRRAGEVSPLQIRLVPVGGGFGAGRGGLKPPSAGRQLWSPSAARRAGVVAWSHLFLFSFP